MATRGWVGIVLAVALMTAACSGERKAVSEIHRAFDRGEYRETVALCRHAIRRNIDSGEVYYYFGAALVKLKRDYEGVREFSEAARRDPELAVRASEYLLAEALAPETTASDRARRLGRAVDLNSALDIKGYRFEVADLCFREKNFARAADLYNGAISAYPDTSAAEAAMYNLGVCYTELGSAAEALEVFTRLLHRFPRGAHRLDAEFRVGDLTYAEAEKQFALGNYADVLAGLETLVEGTTNQGLQQRARFLMGETYETMGQMNNAYQQYREIIKVDRGASGRIVERAREKIVALREAGLI